MKKLFSLRPTPARRKKRGGLTSLAADVRCETAEVLENRTLLAAQLIASDMTTRTVSAGETIDVPVLYQTLDDAGNAAALQSNLLGINLHFDADALTFVETSNTSILLEGIQVVPNATRLESDPTVLGDDNDAATETVLVGSWSDSDFALFLGWPNTASTNPVQLFVARFTVNAGFSGSTNINFSANATGNVIGQAAQFNFQSSNLTLSTGQTTTGDPVLDQVDRFPAAARPSFSWSDTGAANYEVWLARISPNQSRIHVAESTSVSGTSWQPPADLTPGQYRLWVRNSGGTWSAEQNFEVKPTLLSPIEPIYNARPTFEWEAIPEAPGYEIFIRTASGDIIATDIAQTSYTPATELDTSRPIRWWIRSSDALFNGGWSDVGVSNLTGRSSVQSASATQFTWQSVTGASRYVLMVQNTDTNEIVVREDQLQGTSHTISALGTGNYQAWVKAIDGTTNLFKDSIWSRALIFSVS